ncbi:hypothetical protein SynPROS91_01708 [Synechococcus sp. PROS-9-1]|nr:hypothetical protein SynPROS91_01708 [Synechococcus sp. PROS-9-1]
MDLEIRTGSSFSLPFRNSVIRCSRPRAPLSRWFQGAGGFVVSCVTQIC